MRPNWSYYSIFYYLVVINENWFELPQAKKKLNYANDEFGIQIIIPACRNL